MRGVWWAEQNVETDLPAVREQLEGEVRAVTVHDEDDRVIFRQPRQRRFHAALDVLDAQVISDPALVYLSRSSRVRSSQVGGVGSAACRQLVRLDVFEVEMSRMLRVAACLRSVVIMEEYRVQGDEVHVAGTPHNPASSSAAAPSLDATDDEERDPSIG